MWCLYIETVHRIRSLNITIIQCVHLYVLLDVQVALLSQEMKSVTELCVCCKYFLLICFVYLTITKCLSHLICCHKNIERHTTHTIVSWPNPKQWVIVHTSALMMLIRQSMYILSIITKEMGKLKTHSPTYCIMDNWENILDHTLDKLYLTGIL